MAALVVTGCSRCRWSIRSRGAGEFGSFVRSALVAPAVAAAAGPVHKPASFGGARAFLPLEPQPSPKSRRKQWFEGWFFRLTDHRALTSVAVVFGSLRRPNEPPPAAFSEHIVVVAYRDGAGVARTEAAYLDAGAVRIRGGAADAFDAPAIGGGGPRVSWWSDEHGGMVVEGDRAMLDVRVAGLRLAANVSAPRVPWDAARPDTAGPEGWLARTGLLPCHYFVHSFGSPARYRLLRRGALVAGGGARDGARRAQLRRHVSDGVGVGAGERRRRRRAPHPDGRPLRDRAAHDALVRARRPRRRARARLPHHRPRPRRGGAPPVRRPLRAQRHLARRPPPAALRIAAPPASFGRPIPVPTLDGFSAAPGAVESYAAVADLVAHARAPRAPRARRRPRRRRRRLARRAAPPHAHRARGARVWRRVPVLIALKILAQMLSPSSAGCARGQRPVRRARSRGGARARPVVHTSPFTPSASTKDPIVVAANAQGHTMLRLTRRPHPLLAFLASGARAASMAAPFFTTEGRLIAGGAAVPTSPNNLCRCTRACRSFSPLPAAASRRRWSPRPRRGRTWTALPRPSSAPPRRARSGGARRAARSGCSTSRTCRSRPRRRRSASTARRGSRCATAPAGRRATGWRRRTRRRCSPSPPALRSGTTRISSAA